MTSKQRRLDVITTSRCQNNVLIMSFWRHVAAFIRTNTLPHCFFWYSPGLILGVGLGGLLGGLTENIKRNLWNDSKHIYIHTNKIRTSPKLQNLRKIKKRRCISLYLLFNVFVQLFFHSLYLLSKPLLLSQTFAVGSCISSNSKFHNIRCIL